MKIIVYHTNYGCDTGCCGHRIEDDFNEDSTFKFEHPHGQDHLEYAKEFLIQEYGREHLKDLDWDNCIIVDGDNC
jgi:hypothetical protein